MKDEVAQLIGAYFDDLISLLNKVRNLQQDAELDGYQYKRIALPALYSIIESLAYSLYVSSVGSSRERFKKLLMDYSKHKEELAKIDVAFLYQWDKSESFDDKKYKDIIPIHAKIKSSLVSLFGDDEVFSINMSKSDRFQERGALFNKLKDGLDPKEYLAEEKLDLFNRMSVIYIYGRCATVHQGASNAMGFIDVGYLLTLLDGVLQELKKECEAKRLLPFQLNKN